MLAIPDCRVNQKQIDATIGSEWWRLNNLYWIKDKKGKKVKFRPNWAQALLYRNMWFLNIVLKARQLGMTTFIQIFMLDRCLFNRNQSAGVIAHNREDAESFFKDKIKFAYDNLPDEIRLSIPAEHDSAKQLRFSNGSSIRVGTSLRSGTLQYLHISEFGKVCAKVPDKAQEIITGSLNTVEAGQFVFIESTAEGAWGFFHDMCQEAMSFAGNLTKLDYKFFFFSWWQHPDYVLYEPVEIPQDLDIYFHTLEQRHGIKLDDARKAWYAKKKQTQKGKMKQEYPSTPNEAFEEISEFAVYGKELGKVMEEGRICNLPVHPSRPVDLFLDIGKSLKTDSTCVWFMQHVGTAFHFIDYYADKLQLVSEYVRKIRERGYNIGKWYLPHDADSQKDYDIKTFKSRLIEAGISESDIIIVPVVSELRIGIDMMRDVFPYCYFDEVRCADGIKALKAYSYEYDERRATITQPRHDWASHPADSIRQFAQGYRHNISNPPVLSDRRKAAMKRNRSSRYVC